MHTASASTKRKGVAVIKVVKKKGLSEIRAENERKETQAAEIEKTITDMEIGNMERDMAITELEINILELMGR